MVIDSEDCLSMMRSITALQETYVFLFVEQRYGLVLSTDYRVLAKSSNFESVGRFWEKTRDYDLIFESFSNTCASRNDYDLAAPSVVN